MTTTNDERRQRLYEAMRDALQNGASDHDREYFRKLDAALWQQACDDQFCYDHNC